MTWWIIAAAIYIIGAAGIVAIWYWARSEGDPNDWDMCAVVALFWPLLWLGGLLA